MSGFVLIKGIIDKNRSKQKKTLSDTDLIYFGNYCLYRKTNNKFIDDKVFYQDDNFIIVLEGVILNKNQILKNNNLWFEQIIELYKNNGESFFNEFRGSFSGLLFDIKKDKWIIFTDHIGSKSIFYSKIDNDKFIFASDFHEVFNNLKENRYENNLDVNAAYMLLSYGYMLEDNTLSKNIKKILPGNYIKIENGEFLMQNYFKFTNEPNTSLSDEEIIDNIDYLYRQAVKRQFQKDKEYNYKHFVGLSGGLDSRMTTWVAHDMGYTNQLNFSFSQSEYLDQTTPQQIASDLKHEWIFKALDNGLFLKNVDEVTLLSGGVSNYLGLAHGLSLYKYLDFSNLGILHTGQLGDVILGTYSSANYHIKNFNIESGAYVPEYVSKIDFSNINIDFENEELFKFYQRGFSGMNSGLLSIQNFTETMSPFYDIDFMSFSLSIPVNKRFKHKIYFKWLEQKYPGAQKYIWEKINKKPLKGSIRRKFIKFKGRNIDLFNLHNLILNKTGIRKYGVESNKHMNPYVYWYNNNEDLRLYINDYFKINISYLDNYPDLKKDAESMFKTKSVFHMIQVITLLSALKNFKF